MGLKNESGVVKNRLKNANRSPDANNALLLPYNTI